MSIMPGRSEYSRMKSDAWKQSDRILRGEVDVVAVEWAEAWEEAQGSFAELTIDRVYDLAVVGSDVARARGDYARAAKLLEIYFDHPIRTGEDRDLSLYLRASLGDYLWRAGDPVRGTTELLRAISAAPPRNRRFWANLVLNLVGELLRSSEGPVPPDVLRLADEVLRACGRPAISAGTDMDVSYPDIAGLFEI